MQTIFEPMTSPLVKIIPCPESELDSLRIFAAKSFHDTFAHLNEPGPFEEYMQKAFHPTSFQEEFQNPDSFFFLAKIDDQIAGYTKLNFSPAQTDVKDPQSLEIQRIYLDKSQKGKGIGKLLLHHSLDFARQKRLNYVWLGVWDQNHHAIEFYERQGFQKFGKHSFLMGEELQTDFLMRMDIPLL